MKLTKIIAVSLLSIITGCGSSIQCGTQIVRQNNAQSKIENNHYVVKEGDNLTKIAVMHETSLTELLSVNEIKNPDLIFPGQTINLPVSSRLAYKTYQSLENQFFENDSDQLLLARLLYGEARGESRELKTDIAYSVLNRVGQRKWWGNSLKEVILKPFQYSCFNKDDSNYSEVINPTSEQAWNECLTVAQEVLSNLSSNNINGATHYYSTSISKPFWTEGKTPVKVVQNNNGYQTNFYKLEK